MTALSIATSVTIDPRRHDAVIFDLDGVITDTASIHAAAWTELFDGYLSRRRLHDSEDHSPFTLDDYQLFVDGKPRNDGVRDFLASRCISLPWNGDANSDSVLGLAIRKDRLFLELITRGGVPAFESTIALVKQLHGVGLGVAVFSSSRNCEQVLNAAGIGNLFEVRVDGVVAEDLGLPGKPDPAVLVEAAHRLGAAPGRTVVIEDAVSGVSAGHHGGFALVVGVDRTGHADELRCHGADVVVADLAEVDIRTCDLRLSEIPDALPLPHELAGVLRTRRSALFLDFDGTLSNIVNDPTGATLVAGAATALTRLARDCPVAIISGRDLPDVQTRVGLTGIWYAGSHGFELVGPSGEYHQNDAALAAVPYLDRAAIALQVRLGEVPGIFLERKRFGVAVHYRNVAADRVEEVVAAVREAAGHDGTLRVTTGRMVTELRPNVDWDKGRALRWILEHVRHGDALTPIYFGDDMTDEDAFDALPDSGVGVVVRNSEDGDRRSAATFAVDTPDEITELLRRLAELTGRDLVTDQPIDAWTISYTGYDPPTEKLREALCTVGNGVFATRGCAPESDADAVHYPGTYAAGVYNRLEDEISGTVIDNESLVNLPNWLPLTIRIDGGSWFDIDSVDLLDYRQELDLRSAVLTRRFRFRDDGGRTTSIVQRRFVAMHLPHVCALQMTLAAENWSGRIEFRSTLDGAVRNTLVERYRDLASAHLDLHRAVELGPDSTLLVVTTNQSRVPVAMAARNTLWRNDEPITGEYRYLEEDAKVGHDIGVYVSAGESVTLEKVVTLVTGRDHAVSDPSDEAQRWVSRLGRFDEILDGHVLAWTHLWSRFSIELDGQDDSLRIIRFHLLHLLQTVSPNTADLDAGVPARGLHGEAYRGHIFWDELFVFPVLNLRLPALTRSLLRYRYRRLGEARSAANAAGLPGAMFPWQSSGDGREESQKLHLNPKSGRWNPDPSQRQHHIGLAIAFNVWQYYEATGDVEFLTECGAEMLVEIARFFAGLASYDQSRDRYTISGVIGPDEFHSGYPGKPYDGIDNNAYTNVMSVWVILRALDALDMIPNEIRSELMETLGVSDDELTMWRKVSRRMFVPFHEGVISQFESYGELAELDWDGYRTRYGDIARLDRILEAEGDDINRYQASKQADVLMLFYLLSADELGALLERLGYELERETIPRTIDYYMARTSHGSTLSAVVHSWVLARADRNNAMAFFDRVLQSDIADIQGGTTAEGIHLAAMAGSIDLLQRCFSGLETRGDRLVLCPQWPEAMGVLKFAIFYRGHRLLLRISGRQATVSADESSQPPIEIECRGEVVELKSGCTVSLA